MTGKIGAILLGIVVFFLFRQCLMYPEKTGGFTLDDGWVLVGSESNIPLKFPWHRSLDNPETLTLRTEVTVPEEMDMLVFPRFITYGYEVSINGSVVYRLGDPETPQANLWNMTHFIALPKPLVGRTVIEVRTAGFYDTGVYGVPYLARTSDILLKRAVGNLVDRYVSVGMLGVGLFLGAILIVMSARRMPLMNQFLYYGLASIFVAIYSLEFLDIQYLGSPTLLFWAKKMAIGSGYLALLSFSAGLELDTGEKVVVSRYIAPMTILAVLTIVAMPTPAIFRSVFRYTNVLMFLHSLGIVILLFFRSGKNRLHLVTATVILLSLGQTMAIIFFGRPWPHVLQFAIIATTALYGTLMLLDFSELYHENRLLHEVAQKDSLTGAYNRQVLKRLHVEPEDSVIMIDVDDLKSVNDERGHAAGDKLLKSLVDAATANLRRSDFLIRMGGDEFLAYLGNTTTDQARRVVQRIREDFREEVPYGDFSHGVHGVGDDRLEDIINLADALMYERKRRKRN